MGVQARLGCTGMENSLKMTKPKRKAFNKNYYLIFLLSNVGLKGQVFILLLKDERSFDEKKVEFSLQNTNREFLALKSLGLLGYIFHPFGYYNSPYMNVKSCLID